MIYNWKEWEDGNVPKQPNPVSLQPEYISARGSKSYGQDYTSATCRAKAQVRLLPATPIHNTQ